MIPLQKFIKYVAIAFGIYLAINIIGAIVFGFTAIVALTTGINYLEENIETTSNVEIMQIAKQYENIKNIDIDLAISKLNIIEKEDLETTNLEVEVKNVSKDFEMKMSGNTLKIEDKKIRTWFNSDELLSVINIYVPRNAEFKEVEIDGGISNISIAYLDVDEIEINSGVGKTDIKNINADYLKLEGGAGETEIENSTLKKLEVEAGVGKMNIISEVTEYAKIEAGIGNLDIKLAKGKDEYKIKTQKGLGTLKVAGENVSDGQIIGNGSINIDVEAGIGNLNMLV